MNKNDGENKKKEFDFIETSLKTHIGNLVDDFLFKNMNNKLNEYIADGFSVRIIRAFKKVEEEIIKKLEVIE